MPREATFIPAESSILCEHCGYTLDGLPESGNCPECGQPVDTSRTADGRRPPAWEQSDRPAAGAFLRTTWAVISAPTTFYRTLATRHQSDRALLFARLHWLLSAILLGGALYQHTRWYSDMLTWPAPGMARLWVLPAAIATVYLLVWGTTRAAAALTAWEAAYRGYRLPKPVVLRGLYYHAAHYLPVGIAAFATTAGYRYMMMFGLVTYDQAHRYLIVLCAEVILSAAYLFRTYWAGMRNMMYANR